MSDEVKYLEIEQSVGAIAILAEILPKPQWYKDDPKQGNLIGRSFAACEALPDVPPTPVPEKDETKDAFEARIDAWAEPLHPFKWTEKQRQAVRVCVQYFLKQGAFSVTKHTISLLRLLTLDEE